ncbi:MAG: hypothetical protein CM15mP120_28410 [Pseudomonadota bacterium]|nr:MAG: hypothetical protein CM15mP120_28410 [Pseudomonadota bacterium]
MEMYVDANPWVMGPNVYGMGLFSEGGIFATKPYICGSNYLLKIVTTSVVNGATLLTAYIGASLSVIGIFFKATRAWP